MRNSNIRARRNFKFLKRFSRSEEISVRLTWSAFKLFIIESFTTESSGTTRQNSFHCCSLGWLIQLKFENFKAKIFHSTLLSAKSLHLITFDSPPWSNEMIIKCRGGQWTDEFAIWWFRRFWFSDCHATFQRWGDVWSHWLSKVMTKVIKLSQLKDEENFRKASLDQSFQTF